MNTIDSGAVTNAAARLAEDLKVGGNQSASGVFEEALTRASVKILEPQHKAAEAVQSFSQGFDGHLHETLMAVDKADISLKFFANVRSKLIEAYRELMRMGG